MPMFVSILLVLWGESVGILENAPKIITECKNLLNGNEQSLNKFTTDDFIFFQDVQDLCTDVWAAILLLTIYYSTNTLNCLNGKQSSMWIFFIFILVAFIERIKKFPYQFIESIHRAVCVLIIVSL